ncbi:phosphodiester glycosidase family protein [Chryseobacterium sp.]|uniref:phosphodiester glycosidase family protein n=1 Tax=Chryseobacterium sp. TaxID=1871047 RepID=UPI0031DCE6AE
MIKNSISFSNIKKHNTFYFISLLFLFCFGCKENIKEDDRFVTFRIDPEKQDIQLYWKNNKGEIMKSIDVLRNNVETQHKKLVFAMNGGMFEPDNSPKGLYIEDFKILKPLDTLQGTGNFYLEPNGVLYLTQNNSACIIETRQYQHNKNIRFATQSGPMLIINRKINPIFQKNSKNLNIRNGVGILENGKLVFAMSKKEISFYHLAEYFKNLGCKEALYLDGYVSRTYLPEKNWIQKDGNFGVMIGVTESSE